LHTSDAVVATDAKHRFTSVEDTGIKVMPLSQSRAFFASLGIAGEAVFTLPMLVPYAAMFISSFSVNGRTSLTLGHRSSDSRQRAASLLQMIVDAVQKGDVAA
ncbi:MAG: hypothetical protein ACFN04_09540, partial [Propionibacterium acidifaciens]